MFSNLIEQSAFVVVMILSLSLLFGCETEIPDISMSERKIADSLYRKEMKTFRPEMDSLCEAYQDSLLPIYIDSMEKARIAEIERQLERIKSLK